MAHLPLSNVLWGERSIERARRWIDRIRPLVDGATADAVPEHVRFEIMDFTAAALGEAIEVLEKAKTQLEDAYRKRGKSKSQAEKRAKDFVRDWLQPRSFMRGMLAVRHLDVHVEARYSGRMIKMQANGASEGERVWWTHPAIPKSQHDLLHASSRLSEDELATFNQHMLDTDVLRVLAEMLDEVSQFQKALAAELLMR